MTLHTPMRPLERFLDEHPSAARFRDVEVRDVPGAEPDIIFCLDLRDGAEADDSADAALLAQAEQALRLALNDYRSLGRSSNHFGDAVENSWVNKMPSPIRDAQRAMCDSMLALGEAVLDRFIEEHPGCRCSTIKDDGYTDVVVYLGNGEDVYAENRIDDIITEFYGTLDYPRFTEAVAMAAPYHIITTEEN